MIKLDILGTQAKKIVPLSPKTYEEPIPSEIKTLKKVSHEIRRERSLALKQRETNAAQGNYRKSEKAAQNTRRWERILDKYTTQIRKLSVLA